MTILSLILMFAGLALFVVALQQSQKQTAECDQAKAKNEDEQTSLFVMFMTFVSVFISLFTVIGLS